MHAEAVLLVDDGQSQIVERDVVLEQRVGADDQIDVAEHQPVEDGRALAAALAPGEDGDADAGGFGQRRDGLHVLARQNFGRRHEGGLAAGFDHRRCRDQRHYRFAGADVALQQSQHALRQRQVVDDVVDRPLLRMGQRIRQRFHDARAQQAFAGRAASGLAAHMRTHQGERELPGQQFVEGQPRPGAAFGRHVMRLRRPVQMT